MDISSVILQLAFSGIMIGSIYSIIAMGFSIIYNATDSINFAQGEFVMLGGMIAVALFSGGMSIITSFFASVLIVTIIGMICEILVIRPMKNPTVLNIIIVTIGISVLLKGGTMFIWGKDTLSLPSFSDFGPIHFMGATFLCQALWIIGIAITIMFLVSFFFRHTITGKAMMAVAFNKQAAGLMGINVKRMVTYSFVISSAIGSISGIVMTPVTLIAYDKGGMPGLKGFCAAMLGGFGSIPGAIIGGTLLGLSESFGAGFISSAYKDVIAFLILLAILFFRPTGIMGRK